MFHVTDWYPTLMDMLSKDPTGPAMDGVSEWAGLVDSSDVWGRGRDERVYNIMTEDDHPYIPEAAIRVGDWKYLWRVTGDDSWQEPPEIGTTQDNDLKVDNLDRKISHTNQLFNLAEDPTEKILHMLNKKELRK